jgi:hypothetical protein
MLPKTRRGFRRMRSGALTLTLTAFVPLAIPAAASASSYAQGNELVNTVNADTSTNSKTVFNVKFQLGEGASPAFSAVNRATATTSDCANCTTIAIGFQVVTATEAGLLAIHTDNVATATNDDCTVVCSATADAYQVVVATDSSAPMSFYRLLSPQQFSELNKIGSEFNALPDDGLTLTQVQAECQSLVNQAIAILQAGNGGTAPVTSRLPAFSPAIHGAGTDTGLTTSDAPVVNVYRDIQSKLFPAS